MAKATIDDLRRRVSALGYELFVTDRGEQLVIEHRQDDVTEAVFIHRDAKDDPLEDWIADREKVSERVRRGKANGSDEQDEYLFHGDHPLPAELQPALDLYKRLFHEAEALPDDVIMRRLGDSEIVVGRYGHEYTLVRPNLTRRGVSFFYADWKLHEILGGVEPAQPMHEQITAEIREEYPDADEREIKLRVAIRESMITTPEQEDDAYERIAAAVQA